jgi:hypothetical protein
MSACLAADEVTVDVDEALRKVLRGVASKPRPVLGCVVSGCRATSRGGPIRMRTWVAPYSAEDMTEVVFRGYLCEDHAVVYWAWDDEGAVRVTHVTLAPPAVVLGPAPEGV